MKPLITFAIFITMAINLVADTPKKTGEGYALPSERLKSYEELKTWAEGSSFGGGYAFTTELGGRKIFHSDRMFTSGVSTSELIFFYASGDGMLHPFLRTTVLAKEHKTAIEDENLVVRCFDRSKQEWPIALTITPWMLPNP